MSTKILITGAGGYIGSVASKLFLGAGYDIVAVDNYSRGYSEPLKLLQQSYGEDRFRFYEADLRNSGDCNSILDKEQNIQAVIHYAAFCNVGESEEHPELYFHNNVLGTLNLLESMREHDIKKILFSSTCSLYGEPMEEFITEEHPVNPTSHPYSESKFMSERIIQWYATVYGFAYIFLRYFNVCGATDDGEFGDSKHPSFHLMQNAICGALGIAPFYLNNTIVDTPDKTPIRDYVNVVDLNEAHIKAVEYLISKGVCDVFNLGTGTGNSVLEIIKAVEKATGKSIKLNEGERRKGDVSKAVASNKKITEVLGWVPVHSLDNSVESLITWYTKHPHGWES